MPLPGLVRSKAEYRPRKPGSFCQAGRIRSSTSLCTFAPFLGSQRPRVIRMYIIPSWLVDGLRFGCSSRLAHWRPLSALISSGGTSRRKDWPAVLRSNAP